MMVVAWAGQDALVAPSLVARSPYGELADFGNGEWLRGQGQDVQPVEPNRARRVAQAETSQPRLSVEEEEEQE